MAGNASGGSAALTITVDTAAPAVTANRLTTNDATPLITGAVSDGALQVVVNGKTYTAGDGNLTVNATNWSLLIPAGNALPLGTYDVAASATDTAGNTGSDGTTSELEIVRLIVTGLTPTRSGFVVQFSGPVQAGGLNLYDGAGGTLGAADVVLHNGAGQVVAGSLVLDSSQQAITFVKSGGVLPPDTYTVTLKSGATAFRDIEGLPLDGNEDGISGDDYSAPLTVDSSAERIVSIPDFARGAGQPVNIPHTSAGLPIRIDDATSVTSLSVELVVRSSLLEISAVSLAAGLPGDWTVDPLETHAAGDVTVTKVTAWGTTPLSGSQVEVVRLTATVPTGAAYGDSEAILLQNVTVNGGAIAAAGDVAIHKAAYLGDADGSGIHSSADAFLVVQAALSLASGFPAHAWTDPRIVGDADGSGLLSAADAFLIVQEGLGLSEPFVPDNPHIGVTHVGGGIDPQFRIGTALPALVGGAVTVPVQLDVDAAATNVGGLDFDLFFDASQLTLEVPGGVSPGAATAGDWAVSATLVAPGQLRVGMLNLRGQPLVPGLREIAQLAFRVNAGAAAGLVALDLEPADPHAGGYLWTAADGSLLISPAAPVWHNGANPFDVNGDGAATALDALLVITYVNAHPGDFALPSVAELPARYYDVNDDQACTTLDVLAVINHLNTEPLPGAEGEAAGLASLRAGQEAAVGISQSSPHTPCADIGTRSVPSTIFATPIDSPALRLSHQPTGPLPHLSAESDSLESALDEIADDIAAVWSGTHAVPSRSGFPA